MREIEWTEAALEDMAAIDKGVALRVKQPARGVPASPRFGGGALQNSDNPPSLPFRYLRRGPVISHHCPPLVVFKTPPSPP